MNIGSGSCRTACRLAVPCGLDVADALVCGTPDFRNGDIVPDNMSALSTVIGNVADALRSLLRFRLRSRCLRRRRWRLPVICRY